MGEVFRADDTQLGRQVAIKFLADGAANEGRALERLYREAHYDARRRINVVLNWHEELKERVPVP